MRSGPADQPLSVTILAADLSPSASNSVALALARWLVVSHGPGSVDIVSLWSGGAWSEAFAELGPLWVVNDLESPTERTEQAPLDLGRLADRRHRRGMDRLVATERLVAAAAGGLRLVGLGRPGDGLRGSALRTRLDASGGPIWLAGASGARLLQYAPARRRVIAHQGEFDPPPGQVLTDAEDLAVLRRRPDAWVAGSDAAAARVVDFGARAPVTVLPDLVDSADRSLRPQRSTSTAKQVLAPGEFDWWEVPDSFVQVAWEIARRGRTDIDMLWVGGRATSRMLWPLQHDIRHAGLESSARIAPLDARPLDLLAGADAIAITRRGGLNPAQVRELEAIGVPVVRYAMPGEPTGRTGGSTLVDFLDEGAMADAILSSFDDTDAGRQAREAAVEIRARHSADAAGPDILAVLTGRGPNP